VWEERTQEENGLRVPAAQTLVAILVHLELAVYDCGVGAVGTGRGKETAWIDQFDRTFS
jgi:hypothetical protein